MFQRTLVFNSMNAEEIAVRMRTGRMVAKQKQTDRQIR